MESNSKLMDLNQGSELEVHGLELPNSPNSMTYPWGHERRYNDYPSYIKKMFGGRVQKLSINAGFTCPNRDGSKSTKGCAYCNNNTFRPGYCEPDKSVTQQINEGVQRFKIKYPDARFLAYFQSFSNTYGELELLDRVYSEALKHPDIAGLVIGTRPDCVDDAVLDLIAEKAKNTFLTIEYGIESTLDRTLDHINRQHTFIDTIVTIEKTKARSIHTGGHLIMGLPGESREEMLQHAVRVSDLQIDTLKLHQLQIVKNTTFAAEYRKNPEKFDLFELGDYIDFSVDFLELLSPDIKVERFVNQSPGNMLIAPAWGLKNYEIVSKIETRLSMRDSWQGKFFAGSGS